MARIEEIERRLLNWARWSAGRSGGYAAVKLGQVPLPRDPYADKAIHTNDAEGSETDAAVAALPSELKATVVEFYLGRGGMRDHARALGCAEQTIYRRVDQAHVLLDRYFADRRAAADAERRRVERLGRVAVG